MVTSGLLFPNVFALCNQTAVRCEFFCSEGCCDPSEARRPRAAQMADEVNSPRTVFLGFTCMGDET